MFLILLGIILTIPIKVLYTFYTLGAIAEIGHCNVREADFEAELLWRAQKEFREQVCVFIQQIWTIYFWLIWINTMWLHHLNSSVSDGSLVRLGATLRARWLSKWSLGWHEICLFGSICIQTWLDGTTAVGQWDLSINQPHPINSCCWKPTTFWTICRSADFSWTWKSFTDSINQCEIQIYHPKRQWQLCAELAIGALQTDGWEWWMCVKKLVAFVRVFHALLQ